MSDRSNHSKQNEQHMQNGQPMQLIQSMQNGQNGQRRPQICRLVYHQDHPNCAFRQSPTDFHPVPCTTNEYCWNCRHPFTTQPIFIPYQKLEGGAKWTVYGCACSPQCGRRVLDDLLRNICRAELFNEFAAMLGFFGGEYQAVIQAAPSPFYLLKKFHGWMDIDRFRSLFCCLDHPKGMSPVMPVQDYSRYRTEYHLYLDQPLLYMPDFDGIQGNRVFHLLPTAGSFSDQEIQSAQDMAQGQGQGAMKIPRQNIFITDTYDSMPLVSYRKRYRPELFTCFQCSRTFSSEGSACLPLPIPLKQNADSFDTVGDGEVCSPACAYGFIRKHPRYSHVDMPSFFYYECGVTDGNLIQAAPLPYDLLTQYGGTMDEEMFTEKFCTTEIRADWCKETIGSAHRGDVMLCPQGVTLVMDIESARAFLLSLEE